MNNYIYSKTLFVGREIKRKLENVLEKAEKNKI